jgi:hypothetical protein
MTGNGLTIDDRTTLQKIKQIDAMTILTEAKSALDLVKQVKGLVEALV